MEIERNNSVLIRELLAESMVLFHMIDMATFGIRRAYNIQKSKYFPMPDYNISTGTQVEV